MLVSFSKGQVIICHLPLFHNPAVFDPHNTVGKLGNLVVVGNHDNRLIKLHAGTF